MPRYIASFTISGEFFLTETNLQSATEKAESLICEEWTPADLVNNSTCLCEGELINICLDPRSVSPEQRFELLRTYLDNDAQEHIKAHGKWSLDKGKLLAAFEQAGIDVK